MPETRKENIPKIPGQAAETPEQSGDFEAPSQPEDKVQEAVVPAPAVTTPQSASVAQASPKDETTKEIESILEEDLADTYADLPPETKQKFKAEGENVTKEITTMMKTLKVKARKVLGLIRDWLKIIPGINKFFLEQEAKIKTDKVLHMAEEEKSKRETLE